MVVVVEGEASYEEGLGGGPGGVDWHPAGPLVVVGMPGADEVVGAEG